MVSWVKLLPGAFVAVTKTMLCTLSSMCEQTAFGKAGSNKEEVVLSSSVAVEVPKYAKTMSVCVVGWRVAIGEKSALFLL